MHALTRTEYWTGRLLGQALPARLLPSHQLIFQFLRYGLVSATSLCMDLALFLALAGAGIPASLAGAAGYAAGLILHFGLSVCFVFGQTKTKSRSRLFGEFAASGIMGLLMTSFIIGLMVDRLHTSAVSAKLTAVLVTFVTVFVLRRHVVFASFKGESVKAVFSKNVQSIAMQLIRYALTSGTALVADMSAFIALLSVGLSATLAGLTSFGLGVVTHYVIGTRFVFDTQAVRRSRAQLFAEYATAGMTGAILTTCVIATATSSAVGMPPLAAKVLAIGLNFVVVFTLLRNVVFRSDFAARPID
jgi:putative flippase GtrA